MALRACGSDFAPYRDAMNERTPVSEPISRFPPPDLADLPPDIGERIAAVQEKSGFVPNVFLALARRPDEFRAFFAIMTRCWRSPAASARPSAR
jgi:hypothetical protein